MFSEKLGTLLLQLSPSEMQRLGKFVASPYFNEHEQVTQLFEVLKALRAKGIDTLSEASKPQIWKQVFGNKPYHDGQLRKLIFELTQLAYQFLTVESMMGDQHEAALLSNRAVQRQGWEKHQLAAAKRLESEIFKTDAWRPERFLQAHEFKFQLLDQDNPGIDLPEQLRQTRGYLDLFYVLRGLKMAITLKTFALSRKSELQEPEFVDFIRKIAEEKAANFPIVEVYYKAYLSFAQPENEQLYQILKAALHTHVHNLHVLDLFDVYQYALNFCVLRINAGNQDYYRELFELYRRMTDTQLILAKGELAEGMFKNIITAGLAVKEYSWVEQFIREKSMHLPEGVRANAMSFNLANVLFSQKKYDEVIGLLQKVEYSDLVYHLGARWLLIRTYYELNALKPLDSLLDSFRVYLLRNKVLSNQVKKEYLSLISLTRKLLKSRFEKDKLKALKAKVLTTQIQVPKRWLIEKIEELGVR
jgi:hypothetical protein